MIGKTLSETPANYDEAKKKQATKALQNQFHDFGRKNQLAVLELLRKMCVAGNFAEYQLEEALHTMGDELFLAEAWGSNRDNRGDNLALLSRQENDLVGRTFTVQEIKNILEAG